MKNFFFIFFCIFWLTTYGQDKIVLNSGDTIKGVVFTKSVEDLFYYKPNKRDKVEKIPLANVKEIIYGDKSNSISPTQNVPIAADLPNWTAQNQQIWKAGEHLQFAAKNRNTANTLLFLSLGTLIVTPILMDQGIIKTSQENFYWESGIAGLLCTLSFAYNLSGNYHIKIAGILLNKGKKVNPININF